MSEPLVEAYVLHCRKYRDTSVIAELLTASEGRLAAVVRGVRSQKSRIAGQVQPFAHLLISWVGRGELKTARSLDFPYRSVSLSGQSLMLGLYVNELLVRLLGKYDPMPAVFDQYGELLARLESGERVNAALRSFELTLLQELGYGITFEYGVDGEPVDSEAWYRYVPEEGFHCVSEPRPDAFKGEDLLSIVSGALDAPDVDLSARRIIRSSIAVLLGGRPLKSRDLFARQEDRT